MNMVRIHGTKPGRIKRQKKKSTTLVKSVMYWILDFDYIHQNCYRAGEMLRHKDTSSSPQYLHKSQAWRKAHACNPSASRGRQDDLKCLPGLVRNLSQM